MAQIEICLQGCQVNAIVWMKQGPLHANADTAVFADDFLHGVYVDYVASCYENTVPNVESSAGHQITLLVESRDPHNTVFVILVDGQ
jgi:hypothetical protein